MPTTEHVVRYRDSSSSDNYSLDLTAEGVLDTAQ